MPTKGPWVPLPVFDSAGKQVGAIEIKLHDDAGDLEVWLIAEASEAIHGFVHRLGPDS